MLSKESSEEDNFIRIAKILLDTIPKYLRRLFVEKWNWKYPDEKWQSNMASGVFLLRRMPRRKSVGPHGDNIMSGNEAEWDISTLRFAMLRSGLDLIPNCRPGNQRSVPLLISEEIEVIWTIRNQLFNDTPSMRCSSATFTEMVSKIKSVAKNIFGVDAENKVDKIAQLQIITVKTLEQLKYMMCIENDITDKRWKLLNGKVL